MTCIVLHRVLDKQYLSSAFRQPSSIIGVYCFVQNCTYGKRATGERLRKQPRRRTTIKILSPSFVFILSQTAIVRWSLHGSNDDEERRGGHGYVHGEERPQRYGEPRCGALTRDRGHGLPPTGTIHGVRRPLRRLQIRDLFGIPGL